MNNNVIAQPLSNSYAEWSASLLETEIKFLAGKATQTPVMLATVEAMQEELDIRVKFGL